MTSPKHPDGFSLLEVIIALTILSFISIGIYTTTSSTFKLREDLTQEGDFLNAVRVTLGLMTRDLSVVYSPHIMAPEPSTPTPPAGSPGFDPRSLGDPPDAKDMALIMSSDFGRQTRFWAAAMDKSAIRPSRFQGTDEKLSFVTLSHVRIYKDAPETEFAKVSYELQRDTQNKDHPDTMVLVKTEWPSAFAGEEDKDKTKRTYPLLHGIKKWKYGFRAKGKDTALRSWDSDGVDTKNVFPEAVELQFEVQGPGYLSFEGTYKFRLEIPMGALDATL